MTKEYKIALAEVNGILENSDMEILEKIPEKFIDFIKANMDLDYQIELDFSKSLVEQDISKIAKKIISLIYRDYLVQADERIFLLQYENRRRREIEDEKRKKYDIKFD